MDFFVKNIRRFYDNIVCINYLEKGILFKYIIPRVAKILLVFEKFKEIEVRFVGLNIRKISLIILILEENSFVNKREREKENYVSFSLLL